MAWAAGGERSSEVEDPVLHHVGREPVEEGEQPREDLARRATDRDHDPVVGSLGDEVLLGQALEIGAVVGQESPPLVNGERELAAVVVAEFPGLLRRQQVEAATAPPLPERR